METTTKQAVDQDYTQLVVWPGTVIGAEHVQQFTDWMLSEFGCRVKYAEEVLTNPTPGEPNEPGGRNDAMFFVHTDDVGKFAIPKLAIGARWWEDVVKYNDNRYLYSQEILDKYPPTW
jgi:hypothetical protein